MTWTRAWGSLLLVLLIVSGGVRAGEPEEGPAATQADARARLVADFLSLLRARLEVGLQRADALREAGHLDQAIAAYGDLGRVHEQEMARLDKLLERVEKVAPAQPTPPEPIRIRVRPGGALRRPSPAGPVSTEAVRSAIESALAWLAAHQSPTGAWEAARFQEWCRGQPAATGEDGQGKALYDVGVTGLAVLAFVRMGHSHSDGGDTAQVVAKGLEFLQQQQDAEGCFGSRTSQHYVYSHAIATQAFVEAYALSPDDRLRKIAQRGLDFIALARNPYFAWRYGIKPGENDTSVTGWMLSALGGARDVNQAAASAGKPPVFVVDEAAFDGAMAWIEKMTDPDYGRVGYIQRGGSPARPQEMIDRFPGDRSEAMTATGLVIRGLCSQKEEKSPILAKSIDLLLRLPPTWDEKGSVDMVYWYYGTLALSKHRGKPWRVWRDALVETLLSAQRHSDGGPCAYDGSWDPVGPWGADGGRVYSTALTALTLALVLPE